LPFFIGRHVGGQTLLYVVHNFGNHLFARQFALIEQNALVFVL
jgi:hypothetical protein